MWIHGYFIHLLDMLAHEIGVLWAPTSADRPPNSASTDFGHQIPHVLTLLDTLSKQKLKWRQHLAGRPHFGLVGPGLCAMSSPRVILSVTMSYFGILKICIYFLFIWCFFIIRCSWNGGSTKLVELVSNQHLSFISCIKCRYVDDKYMHFMTANILASGLHVSISTQTFTYVCQWACYVLVQGESHGD
jgi:hypothetical protein